MRKNSMPRNAILCALATASLSAGMTNVADFAWAKHKKTVSAPTSSDPCASPTAFIQDHVAKIRALQAAQGSHPSTFVGLFGSQNQFDQDTNTKISELRHDADGVNDLLQAGGCNTVDIDKQLKAASKDVPKSVMHKAH